MTVPTDYSQINKMAAEMKRLRDALERIACRDDKLANWRLEQTGSYSGFDEPGSVKIARETLADTSQPLRTCATCHAILADGPQPATTYANDVACRDKMRATIERIMVSQNGFSSPMLADRIAGALLAVSDMTKARKSK